MQGGLHNPGIFFFFIISKSDTHHSFVFNILYFGRLITGSGGKQYDIGAKGIFLNLSPGNHIAVKNLERLKFINSKIPNIQSQRHSNSNTFIEGSGKSCVVSLKKVAKPTILLQLAPGEDVKLQQNRNILIACDDSGNKIGEIDTKLGARIIRLINGGNKYTASIISCGDNWINIILRETFKSPSQKSIISFPSIDKSSNNFSESRRNLSSAIAERELKEIDATYMKDWSNDDTEPGDDTFFEPNMEKIIENIEFET